MDIANIDPKKFVIESQYIYLRESLLSARDRIIEELEINSFTGSKNYKYMMDMTLGLELYEILNSPEFAFSNRLLSNDDMWRYLHLRVVPEIIQMRWGRNADHFYKNNRRLYLKTLYWYIHVSWMGDKSETKAILEKNNTDIIAGFVERPNLGYDVLVYREMMRQIDQYDIRKRNQFRTLMKLNTARLKVISPDLVSGGIHGYVANLIDAVIL
ncbi:hypothetical protein [Carnobacterium sp.]|uniref:hypothetical protein n=1 Tax=Carnobacterium sp. TaxID=48221 RepID=UPI002FCBB843